MKLMLYLILPLLMAVNSCGPATEDKTKTDEPVTENSWNPEKTIALIVGVLEWQDTRLATYDKAGREDQKFYDNLLERGVKKDNIIFIKDNDATLSKITSTLKDLLAKSDEGSTFIFYYAGHGVKSEDGSDAYFLNYDANTSDKKTSCLSLSSIGKTIKEKFKGKLCMFFADCCYSGSLNTTADDLVEKGIQSMVLTSVIASSSSTGAWTFTQTLNEMISGKPLTSEKWTDITAEMAGKYITYNMAWTDGQKANFYKTSGFPSDFVLSKVKDGFSGQPHLGEIKKVLWKGKYYNGRIVECKDNKYRIHYFGWGDEWDEWYPFDKFEDIEYKIFPVGSKVQVEWGGEWWAAEVIKRDDIFHYIKYDGYGDEWNEWVVSDRMK